VNWLNRILKPATHHDLTSPSTGFYDIEGQPVPLSLAQQDVRAARELIRKAALNVAVAHGMPQNWFTYEVLTISDDEKAYFQLQVSLRIWDEHLWSLATAFEQKVLKRIREDDVNVARAVRAVLWRVLPDAGCPYDELASSSAWKPEAVRVRNAVYERLRQEIAMPDRLLPAAILGVDGTQTLPMSASGVSSFSDTQSTADTGFHPTRPFMDGVDGGVPVAHNNKGR